LLPTEVLKSVESGYHEMFYALFRLQLTIGFTLRHGLAFVDFRLP